DQLQAIYSNSTFLQLRLDALEADRTTDFRGLDVIPGNQVSTVVELISVSDHCLFAAIDRDYSSVSSSPSPTPNRLWVALQHSDLERTSFNPTGWRLSYDGFERGHVQPEDPCAS